MTGWIPGGARWRAFASADADDPGSSLRAGVDAEGRGIPAPEPSGSDGRDWGFGPDVFDRLLELYFLLRSSGVFGDLFGGCRTLLSGLGMCDGPMDDGCGTAQRLLESHVPDGVDVGSVVGMTRRLISGGWGAGPASCFPIVNDCWFIGNLVSLEALGVGGDALREDVGLACSGRSPMMREALSYREGFAALEPIMAMRSALDPDGDPAGPGPGAESASLAPADREGLVRLLGESGSYPRLWVRALAAECRPAAMGVDPARRAHATRPHRRTAGMLAAMRPTYDGFPCGHGVPLGVIRLLETAGSDSDPDVGMAALDAADTLLAAGLYALDSCGDCDAILTGGALADAIVGGVGLPASFVAETAMAGRPD